MNDRSKFGWISVAVLFGLSAFAAAWLQPRLDAAPSARAMADAAGLKLKLMSFNVRYENDQDLGSRAWSQRVINVVKMLKIQQPDIVGVQEAMHGQVADLWASLDHFEFEGAGRDDGEQRGEYSGVFFRKARFEKDLADHGTFWLSDLPEVVGSKTWGNQIPRITTWLRLIDRETGRGFYVFNTHWDHQNQASREQAAKLIARRIDQRRYPHEPCVLMGDFNSTETNPAICYLAGKRCQLMGEGNLWSHGMLDGFQLLHSNQKDRRTLHFWSDQTRGSLKVDHIFASAGATFTTATILAGDQPMLSDHFPVTVELNFPPY